MTEDDLVVSVTYRISRHPPHAVSWATDREISEEEGYLLFNAIRQTLAVSMAAGQPMPERKM